MSIEEVYVKHVYNTIAKEFSDTRYRPWTCVEEFLDGVEENSYIGDIGCGNGRDSFYFSNNNLDVTAIDYSIEAVESCKNNDYLNKIKFFM